MRVWMSWPGEHSVDVFVLAKLKKPLKDLEYIYEELDECVDIHNIELDIAGDFSLFGRRFVVLKGETNPTDYDVACGCIEHAVPFSLLLLYSEEELTLLPSDRDPFVYPRWLYGPEVATLLLIWLLEWEERE